MTGIYRQAIAPRRFADPTSPLIGANSEHKAMESWGAVGAENQMRHLEMKQMGQFFRSARAARFVAAGDLTVSFLWRPSNGAIAGYYFWQPASPAYYLSAAERERLDTFSQVKPIFTDSATVGFTTEQARDLYDRVEQSGVAAAMVIDDVRAVVWVWMKLGMDMVATHECLFSVEEGTALAERRVTEFRSANDAWLAANDFPPPHESLG